MIAIQSKHAQFPQSMCEYQATKDGRYGWLLCTAHEEDNPILDEIQAEIKLEILNSRVLEISKMEIDKWLKDFFVDFHWKLHARLRKTDLKEKGISLLFAVVYDAEIYFVQFGRMFCAAVKGKRILGLGKAWKNYQIQTMDDMSLFGMTEGDIKVRTQRMELEEGESLIVLPGTLAGTIFDSGTDTGSLLPLIESYSTTRKAMWIVLKNEPQDKKVKKHKWGKLQISTLVLLIATLLTITYMAFGKRYIEVLLDRTKKEISSSKLRLTPTEVIEKIGKIMNYPARNIEFRMGWTADLQYPVTTTPSFTLKNIFLASDKTLVAYDKKSREQIWQKSFEEKIIAIHSLQTGDLVCMFAGHALCLDESGELLWQQVMKSNPGCPTPIPIVEITNNEDKRIDKGISIIPEGQGLIVLENDTGAVMSELKLNAKLKYISSYDDYDYCFYAVVENSLVCINLDIVN